jgi:predicted alpha/beta-fold hydrolase
MGGNVTLLHMGKESDIVNKKVKKAVVFSVPMHLDSSSKTLAQSSNKIYMIRFLRKLHKKVKDKMLMFPDQIDDNNYKEIKSFHHFDNRYTAPIHGFKDAKHYYEECSSIFHLSNIKVPTLIVNAKNDPFLSEECTSLKKYESNTNLKIEIPSNGGHAGFPMFGKESVYWSELRAVEFLNRSY